MSNQFRREMAAALSLGRVRYLQRQKYILRPMIIAGNLDKIPTVPSRKILKLFATNGSNKIYIEDFLNEYHHLVDKILNKTWDNWEKEKKFYRYPDLLEYVKEKDYNVFFNKGDIRKNEYYDPAIKMITEGDGEKVN